MRKLLLLILVFLISGGSNYSVKADDNLPCKLGITGEGNVEVGDECSFTWNCKVGECVQKDTKCMCEDKERNLQDSEQQNLRRASMNRKVCYETKNNKKFKHKCYRRKNCLNKHIIRNSRCPKGKVCCKYAKWELCDKEVYLKCLPKGTCKHPWLNHFCEGGRECCGKCEEFGLKCVPKGTCRHRDENKYHCEGTDECCTTCNPKYGQKCVPKGTCPNLRSGPSSMLFCEGTDECCDYCAGPEMKCVPKGSCQRPQTEFCPGTDECCYNCAGPGMKCVPKGSCQRPQTEFCLGTDECCYMCEDYPYAECLPKGFCPTPSYYSRQSCPGTDECCEKCKRHHFRRDCIDIRKCPKQYQKRACYCPSKKVCCNMCPEDRDFGYCKRRKYCKKHGRRVTSNPCQKRGHVCCILKRANN